MPDYSHFTDQVNKTFKIDLTQYKEAQMRRRLTSLRDKRGYRTFNDYHRAMLNDTLLVEEFIDRITINVSEFYRNPLRWDVLRKKVIPKLIEDNNQLTIWSAACSTGDEPYSLAMMLNEHFPHVRAQIIATDLDEKVLEKARVGAYQAQDLKSLPDFKKSKYFIYKNEKYYIDNALKRYITFKKHDLLKDRYPSNVDLIVCRNVLIYFTEDAKQMIFKQFSQSLKEDGILFVGSTEQIFNPATYQLKLYDTFFYEKINR